MPLRLALADDHPTFRAGLRSYLEAEPDLEVVAEAGTGDGALEAVRDHAPDVLVLDMEMPGLTGLDVTRRVVADGAPTAVLVLSAFEDEAYIFGVLDAGAAGYLSKQEPLPAIVEAVRGVGAGDVGWLSRRISALYVDRHRAGVRVRAERSEAERTFDSLTPREREVLMLLAEGLTNEAIADRLFVSESAVKKHVHGVFSKTGKRTRAQVVAWAWRSGIAGRPGDADRA